MIFIGEGSLRRAIRDFDSHYHLERNHQGIGNRLLQAKPTPTAPGPGVRRRQRLCGMLGYYCATAA
jgi:putative transposase